MKTNLFSQPDELALHKRRALIRTDGKDRSQAELFQGLQVTFGKAIRRQVLREINGSRLEWCIESRHNGLIKGRRALRHLKAENSIGQRLQIGRVRIIATRNSKGFTPFTEGLELIALSRR